MKHVICDCSQSKFEYILSLNASILSLNDFILSLNVEAK